MFAAMFAVGALYGRESLRYLHQEMDWARQDASENSRDAEHYRMVADYYFNLLSDLAHKVDVRREEFGNKERIECWHVADRRFQYADREGKDIVYKET